MILGLRRLGVMLFGLGIVKQQFSSIQTIAGQPTESKISEDTFYMQCNDVMRN